MFNSLSFFKKIIPLDTNIVVAFYFCQNLFTTSFTTFPPLHSFSCLRASPLTSFHLPAGYKERHSGLPLAFANDELSQHFFILVCFISSSFLFLKIFFGCGPFLKSSLNLLQYCFCYFILATRMFHCVHVPLLLYPLICRWRLGCLHVLAVVSRAAVNVGVRVSFQFWFPQGVCIRVGLLGHVVLFLIF